MLRKLKNLPDLSNSTNEDAAIFITNFVVEKIIPNSSTKLSLLPNGYPDSEKIEVTIRSYRDKNLGCKEFSDKSYRVQDVVIVKKWHMLVR